MWECPNCGCQNVAASLNNCPMCTMARYPVPVPVVPVPEPEPAPEPEPEPEPEDNPDMATIRAWAKEQGMDVADRGKLPQAVLDAYVRGD